MNGYLSNVMKFSYAPILYTETNAVEDRAREVEIESFAIPYFFTYMIRDCIIFI